MNVNNAASTAFYGMSAQGGQNSKEKAASTNETRKGYAEVLSLMKGGRGANRGRSRLGQGRGHGRGRAVPNLRPDDPNPLR
jgi:hypothetical protein